MRLAARCRQAELTECQDMQLHHTEVSDRPLPGCIGVVRIELSWRCLQTSGNVYDVHGKTMSTSPRLSKPTCDPAQSAWLHLQLARHQPARLVLNQDTRQDALRSGLHCDSRRTGRVQLNVQHAARVAGRQLLALQAAGR